MNLQEILDFVDQNPKSYETPGSYRVFETDELSITVEHAGLRKIKIVEGPTGKLVFRGSGQGIDIIEGGEWQSKLAEILGQAVPSEPQPDSPPVTVEGTTGAATLGQDGNLVPPTQPETVEAPSYEDVSNPVSPVSASEKLDNNDEYLDKDIFSLPTTENKDEAVV